MAKENKQPKLWRIGAVSRLTGVNPHTLRYWESELQILTPNRRLSKQRLYRQADIALILEIKRLLQEEKYTLQGVKQYLAARRAADSPPGPAASVDTPPPSSDPAVLETIYQELLALRATLTDEPAAA